MNIHLIDNINTKYVIETDERKLQKIVVKEIETLISVIKVKMNKYTDESNYIKAEKCLLDLKVLENELKKCGIKEEKEIEKEENIYNGIKLNLEFIKSERHNYIAKVEFFNNSYMILKKHSEASRFGKKLKEYKKELFNNGELIISKDKLNVVIGIDKIFTDINQLTEFVAGEKLDGWKNWAINNSNVTLKEYLKK